MSVTTFCRYLRVQSWACHQTNLSFPLCSKHLTLCYHRQNIRTLTYAKETAWPQMSMQGNPMALPMCQCHRIPLHSDLHKECTCQARPAHAGGTRDLLRPDQ